MKKSYEGRDLHAIRGASRYAKNKFLNSNSMLIQVFYTYQHKS